MIKNYPILKKLVPLFFSLFAFSAFSQTVITDNIPGTKNFTVPCGVTSITVEAWGGGGGGQRANGNPSAGGGGSGGGYVKTTIAVTAGNNYSYFVGTGGSGNSGVNGTATWFINSATINAVGGVGAGSAIISNNYWGTGATAPNTGNAGGTTVNSYGGNGGNAGNNFSGGGGSSGGSSASNDASGINGGAAPTDGYVGADGRNSNGGGANGNIGAGGAGGRTSQIFDRTGGSGGNGQIRITYTSTFQTYCSPTFTSGVEPITNVTFAGINNTTTNAIGGLSLESFCDIGTVVQGTTHQISLKGNTDGNYTDDFRVFIDWDQNGNFSDTGESYYIGTITGSTGIDSQTLIGNIAVPATATLGNTRMRIMKRWNGDPTDPCQTGTGWGQAEDYTINVTAPTDTYCTSFGNTDYQTAVTSVSFNTINNIDLSPKVVGYKDYTTISTIVTKGLSYDLSVNVNTDGNWTNHTYAWIDWNQDGDFNDMGESFNLGTATNVSNGATLNSPLSIPVPATASVGLTRMRVSTKYFSAPIPCGAGFDGEVEDYTINIVNPPNIWNGSISTDWNIPGNWSVGVPTIGLPNTLDVVIPAGLTNYPIIAAGAVAGYVENIVFEPGATLNVVDNSLRVAVNLTLNGIIDLNGESQLLQDLGSVFDAASTGTIEIDQQGTSDNFKYNYWGSPVNTTGTAYTIAGVLRDGTDPNAFPLTPITFGAPYAFADGSVTNPIHLSTYWMYKYANLGNGYSGWTSVGKDGSLKIGEGFTMKGSNTNLSEQNYTFVGKPNNGVITLPIAANRDYLIGNPYPSAIDAKEFIRDNISAPSGNRTIDVIDGNLYFWDHFGGGNHLLKSYEGGYGIVNLTGEIKAMATDALINNTGNVSTKTPPRFIPVAQGFFVTAVSGIVGTEDIQFKNSQRIYEKESPAVSQFMKSAKTFNANKETNEDVFPKIYLKYSSPKGFHRQLLVGFIENTTDGVDIGYDAINYETFAEDISWKTNNINFIIQAVPTLNDERKLPLEVKVATTGTIKISIDNTENIPVDTEIFIEDSTTGKTHNISKAPFEIELTAGKYADRFSLTFKTQKLMAEDVNAEILIPAASQPIIEGIHVYMNNAIGELQIKNNGSEEITSVALVNTLGQTVKTWNSNFNIRIISLPISTATGIYLVQITTKTGKTVKKISVE